MKLNDYEKQNLTTLRPGLPECMVLLKKDGNFPLAGPCRIAAYGAGARRTIKGGTGSGEVNSRFYINIEEGLKNAGFTVTTSDWLDEMDAVLENSKKQFVADIKRKAKELHTSAISLGFGATMPIPEYNIPLTAEADAAIYVVSRICGEGNDRDEADAKLSLSEIRDILELNERFEKFMLVLNVGSVVDLSPVMSVKNILVLSQLGVEMGAAFADVLLGKVSPSGKLTTTWAALKDYSTIGDFGDKDDTYYKEGIYVGYRYFEAADVTPLFPFGYGLNYGKTEVTEASVSLEGSVVSVYAKVKNFGSFPAKEVVQIYLSAPSVKLDKAAKDLVGFAKTKEIAPGEEAEINVKFNMKDCTSYDEERSSYILEAGDYIVSVGNSSANTNPAAIIKLREEVIVRVARKALGDPGFVDHKFAVDRVIPDVPVLLFDTDSIITVETGYATTDAVEPEIAELSDEELAKLCIGLFKAKGKLGAFVGNEAQTVPGAAGETAHIRDLPYLVMADGPAGVRISKQYFVDKNGGAYPIGSTMLDTISDFLPFFAKFMMKLTEKKPGRKDEIREQYCTAIPIGTAIAQSFNLEFAQSCGGVVGTEMLKFGVHLWLAPALNIHRNILCGRNFEYYSEDPFVSGKMAAAITQGVQCRPECGVTIKHYAANNQEKCRYSNNSHVSERAMREIYLKGFEICIKEANPATVMSSYNLLNGTHTNERRDLIEYMLRCEFGFKGVVMTDWVMGFGTQGKYAPELPSKVMMSGNDLFMPGSQRDFEQMMSALADGSLDRKYLEINASRVYRLALELTKKKVK